MAHWMTQRRNFLNLHGEEKLILLGISPFVKEVDHADFDGRDWVCGIGDRRLFC
jgi:hypothetical protein